MEEDDEIVDGSLNDNNNSYDDGSNSRKSVISRGTTTTTNNKNNNSGGATGSFITNDHQPPQRRPPLGRLNSNNSLMSNNAQSVVSSQERHRPSAQPLLSQQRGHEPQLQQSYTSSLQDDQSTTTTSYDNTRLVTHTLKRENAIQEINVQNYQDDNSILNADEVTSLPEEYVCDEYGVRYHPKKLNESLLPKTTTLNDENDEDNQYQSLNSQYYDTYNSPFNTKNRKWYTILTIIAAVTLALCGLIVSLTLLKDDDRSSSLPSSSTTIIANNINGGGYVYLPNQLFGGGPGGGIVGGQLRRHYQQQLLSSSNNGGGQRYYVGSESAMPGVAVHDNGGYTLYHDSDASHGGSGRGGGLISERGYTPANGGYNGERGTSGGNQLASYQTSGASSHELFHPPPDYNAQQQQQQTANVMSATPLTSYIPPSSSSNNNGGHEPVIILPSSIEEAYMELSILPYNPLTELPVVISIPYGIDELDNDSNIANHVFGKCYKLVQCSQEGSMILDREYAQFVVNGDEEVEEVGSRKLMKLVPKTNEDIDKSEHLRSSSSLLLTHQDAIQGTTYQEEETSNQVVEEDEDHSTYPSTFNPELRTEVIQTSTFVNVDCTTSHGLDRAISSQLLSSNLVDVLHTFNLADMSRLFHEHNNNNDVSDGDGVPYHYYGRPMVMIHNPIHHSIIKYNWLRVTNDNVMQMTLEQFAISGYLDDNILTRTILSKTTNNGDYDALLTEIDLEMAKYVLKHKFIVGLYDEMEQSLQRFESFFGWNGQEGVGIDTYRCQHDEVTSIQGRYYNNVNILPKNEEGGESDESAAIQAIMEKNRMDMKLYEYVMYLFDYQGLTLFGVPASANKE